MTAEQYDAHEKLKDLERQWVLVRLDVLDKITCPYCAGINAEETDGMPCCETFYKASQAIQERLLQNEILEATDRLFQTIH